MQTPESPRSLAAALGVTPSLRAQLREGAHRLFEERRFEQCVDVVLGLQALGDYEASDALLLEQCFRLLGQHELAERCRIYAEQVVIAAQAHLRAKEGLA
jgi:hypothetical protein